ncbi:MAG: DNA replication/repair protein RecF [Cellvibrionaceae bacterium]|nr:DNA replication/repair protein RecF [Cellvibrionaceae bacterium]MCV6627461.1 DNA replication/repair protein RecF [Cellvibrionaceae bacterium]
MAISRLKISNLRNLGAVDLHPSAQLNLIFGANGSGKTSLLEAIHLLGSGRSFRSHRIQPIINHQQDSFVLFSQTSDAQSIGIERGRGTVSQTKIDGSNISSAANLASLLPIQVLEAHSFELIEGPANLRRSYLDWLVFHVKHEFHQSWKSYRKALKHRNNLLRRGRMDRLELRPWEAEIFRTAKQIDQCRLECYELLSPIFNEVAEDFLGETPVKLAYFRGWDFDKELESVFEDGYERDQKLGYSWYGPHRADLKLRVGGHPADQALSRGQQKLLVCALKIAIGRAYKKIVGKQCVYLIDDLPAELDAGNQRRMATWLSDIGAQVFVTAVELQPLLDAWAELDTADQAMFHVKHGLIEQQ